MGPHPPGEAPVSVAYAKRRKRKKKKRAFVGSVRFAVVAVSRLGSKEKRVYLFYFWSWWCFFFFFSIVYLGSCIDVVCACCFVESVRGGQRGHLDDMARFACYVRAANFRECITRLVPCRVR